MPLLDVSDVVSDLNNATCSVVRTTGGYATASSVGVIVGQWVANAPTTYSVPACIVPINGRTRSALPEGIRDKARYVMHCLFDIRTDEAGTSHLCDHVTYEGIEYIAVNPWTFHGHGQYCKVILVSLEN